MKQSLLTLAAALALTALAGAAVASGSMPQPQRVPKSTSSASNADAYARGKDTYMMKIACDSCPVAGGVQDKAAAMALITRIDSGEFELRSSEKRRVKAYLNDRFKLN
jgi:cytochrome c5